MTIATGPFSIVGGTSFTVEVPLGTTPGKVALWNQSPMVLGVNGGENWIGPWGSGIYGASRSAPVTVQPQGTGLITGQLFATFYDPDEQPQATGGAGNPPTQPVAADLVNTGLGPLSLSAPSAAFGPFFVGDYAHTVILFQGIMGDPLGTWSWVVFCSWFAADPNNPGNPGRLIGQIAYEAPADASFAGLSTFVHDRVANLGPFLSVQLSVGGGSIGGSVPFAQLLLVERATLVEAGPALRAAPYAFVNQSVNAGATVTKFLGAGTVLQTLSACEISTAPVVLTWSTTAASFSIALAGIDTLGNVVAVPLQISQAGGQVGSLAVTLPPFATRLSVTNNDGGARSFTVSVGVDARA